MYVILIPGYIYGHPLFTFFSLILIKLLPVSLYFDIYCSDLSTDSRSLALKFHGNAIDKSQLVKKKITIMAICTEN